MAEHSESSNQNAAGMGTSTPGQLPQLSAVKEEIPETVGIGPQLSAVKKEIPETVGVGPQLPAVKIEIPETMGIGPDFSEGPPANVDAVTIAQSAGHGQTDQADPTLQIVQHAQDSSDIPAPSGNREFWKSWNIDVPLPSDKGNSSDIPAPSGNREFWKSWNIDVSLFSDKDEELAEDTVQVSSSYLHSNATSHQWALGAVAELLDNAMDERENGATFVAIDTISNPRDNSPALLIQDNGGGMDPDCLRRCVSFGWSSKKSTHGKYGNGFKTGTMRLGADVIVFTASNQNGVATQSIGLVSTTFMREMGSEQYIFPVVDYEISEGQLRKLSRENEDWGNKMLALVEWSPYSTEEELLKQFDDVKPHGTKIVIYNLWRHEDGQTELDFESDKEDILLRGIFKKSRDPNHIIETHISTRLRYSLRAYSSILYRRMPNDFKIILRGKEVQHYSISEDLKFTELDAYKPQISGMKEVITIHTVIGFTKEAPVINVHGFNVYHKNRLILPFHKVFEESSSRGRGVVGVLEADCIEPTHNKQDFERTQAFNKLENRMKQLTIEYWKRNCINVGYAAPAQPKRKPKPIVGTSGQQESVPHPGQPSSSGVLGNTTVGTGVQLVSPDDIGTALLSTMGTQKEQGYNFNLNEPHVSSIDINAQRISDHVGPDLSRLSYQEPSQSAAASTPYIPMYNSPSSQALPLSASEVSGLVPQISHESTVQYEPESKKQKLSQRSPSISPLPAVSKYPTAIVPFAAAESATDPTSQMQSFSEEQLIRELREENRRLRADIADYEGKERTVRLLIMESEAEIQKLQKKYAELLAERERDPSSS